ncbi:EcsC family protein [Niastella caeni]|uniref:EcsC family protein n=1 Tax=Niastella caeni TaxID=2569763 RepID=A0A4S8HSN2_9BACT|nr:EcsC family protein [Niastella caeni]THU38295.1 EcsC family protein [Niastella caeni]
MTIYEQVMMQELQVWQRRMMRKPGIFNRLSKSVQDKVNSWIPEKVHRAITVTIKQMIRGVLFGAKFTTRDKKTPVSLEESDKVVEEKIKIYRNTAAAEGAITGAGGILLGLADFPLLIAIKIKLLFEIAATYGYSVNDYKERVYILHIFQLAFSSAKHRKNVFMTMKNWDEKSKSLPEDIHQFEWRPFQQEYRDYIDLAKFAQLIPVIGAPVGAVVNYRLIRKLGFTAKMAYHMRWAEEQHLV